MWEERKKGRRKDHYLMDIQYLDVMHHNFKGSLHIRLIFYLMAYSNSYFTFGIC